MNTNVTGSSIRIKKVSKYIKQNTVSIFGEPGEKSVEPTFFLGQKLKIFVSLLWQQRTLTCMLSSQLVYY